MHQRTGWIVTLAAVLLFAWAPLASADPGHGGRMDPDERQRLRSELRSQAFEERMRMRAWRDGAPTPSAGALAPDAAPYRGRGWGDGRRDWGSPAGPPAPEGAPDGRPWRLSPEERQNLRRQLRDARGDH